MAKTYKIFISHSWDHLDDLKRLRNLLERRGYFRVEFTEASPDNPINSDNNKYIRIILSQKIESSDIVLGIAGVYASYSDWMQWELDKAIAKNIPIIGVVPRGNERISKIVSDRANEVVRWNTESIVAAIRRNIQ
ncbi:MAG: TIR domain-containing protein [Bacteroidales bacterium]|nr:TIR domain-containing protein [Bacteroidales bacterium]